MEEFSDWRDLTFSSSHNESLGDLLELPASLTVGTDRGFFHGEPVSGNLEQDLGLREQLIIGAAFPFGQKCLHGLLRLFYLIEAPFSL